MSLQDGSSVVRERNSTWDQLWAGQLWKGHLEDCGQVHFRRTPLAPLILSGCGSTAVGRHLGLNICLACTSLCLLSSNLGSVRLFLCHVLVLVVGCLQ